MVVVGWSVARLGEVLWGFDLGLGCLGTSGVLV